MNTAELLEHFERRQTQMWDELERMSTGIKIEGYEVKAEPWTIDDITGTRTARDDMEIMVKSITNDSIFAEFRLMLGQIKVNYAQGMELKEITKLQYKLEDLLIDTQVDFEWLA